MINMQKVLCNLSKAQLDQFKLDEELFWLNNKGVTKIDSPAFCGEDIVEVNIPASVKSIGYHCFAGCKKLKKVSLSKKLKELGVGAFEGCVSLVEFTCSKNIKSLSDSAFSGCKNLKKFTFSNKITKILNLCFLGNESLKEVILPKKLKYLFWACFKDCKNLENVVFNDKISAIDESVFSGCEKIKKIILPKSVKEIGSKAFKNCKNLSYFEIKNGMTRISSQAFENCKFNYFYKLKNNAGYILSRTKIACDCEEKINISEIEQMVKNFDYAYLFDKEKFNDIIKFVEKAKREKFQINNHFLENILKEKLVDHFLNTQDFRFFAGELSCLEQDLINKIKGQNYSLFLKIAFNLGCFSKQKMLDRSGVETETYVGQFASALFSNLIRKYDACAFSRLIIVNFNKVQHQEFIKFLSIKEDGKNFKNFELLVNLEKSYPGAFEKTMKDFDVVKNKKQTRIKEGDKERNCSWREAIISSLSYKQFNNVAKGDEDIAVYYATLATQKDFDLMSEARRTAVEKNIPHHLLGKPLREETIIESIEKIKNGTAELIADSKMLIDQLYEKKFTFEFLDKHDIVNGIIGHPSLADCCSFLSSKFYGKDIAYASIVAPDVQNIDVRDAKGSIIAKGTLYLNSKSGYAVINNLMVNSKYAKNMNFASTKTDEKKCQDEIDRDLIFNAFKRGIYQFIDEYNKLNPKNRIKKVNIGGMRTAFVSQLSNLKNEENMLYVPEKYKFIDAGLQQRILYEESSLKKDGSKKKEIDENAN